MLKKLISAAMVMGLLLAIPPIQANAANNDWMSKINENKYISQISIPGTHESGAMYEPVSGTAKCQELTIDQQLDAGVRYFDIRCREINDSFAIHHGMIYQHLNFDDVLNSCRTFLKENPSETILLRVKEEYDASNNTKTFEEVLRDYIDKDADLWSLGDTIPTLKESRGKIILVRKFPTNAAPFGIDMTEGGSDTYTSISNNARIEIQNYYKVNNNEEKWNYITSMYDDAVSNDDNILYINYTSGYKPILGIPNINKVRNYINPKLKQYFSEHTSGRYGISIMDFADEEICSEIIQTNF